MCHQTVGLVAAELERRGIATTSVTMLRDVTAKVGTPRALAVPFPLGYPLGRPHDPELQLRVCRHALTLLSERSTAPILRELV